MGSLLTEESKETEWSDQTDWSEDTDWSEKEEESQETEESSEIEESDEQRMKAVKIACSGERAIGVDYFTEHDIVLDHDVFDQGEVIPMSEIVGIPILVSKIRPSFQYAATRGSRGYSLPSPYPRNRMVEELMVCCDRNLAEENSGLYQTPVRWLSNVGNVIVARKDRKPLYAHHVKVLHVFILDAIRESKRHTPRREVQLDPGDFLDFYRTEVIYWRLETEDSAVLARLPTPWSWRERKTFPLPKRLRMKQYKKRERNGRTTSTFLLDTGNSASTREERRL